MIVVERSAPLPMGFLLVSIIGFFVSVLTVWDYSKTWGFTFSIFFAIMFISSMISMSYSEVDRALLRESIIVREAHRSNPHIIKSLKIANKGLRKGKAAKRKTAKRKRGKR